MAGVLSVMFIGPQATSLNHIINLFFFSKLAQLLLEHRVKMGGTRRVDWVQLPAVLLLYRESHLSMSIRAK